MATKGQKFKQWSAEEKYKLIKPVLEMEKSTWEVFRETGINTGLLCSWIKKYREKGFNGLSSKKKPGNPLAKYSRKKELTKEEQLEYENMKIRVENEMLTTEFLTQDHGKYVTFMK